MARNSSTISGITTAGIHAPTVNLEMTTTARTVPVMAAPTVEIVTRSCQRAGFIRRMRSAIDACDSVKLVNTPAA
jgi:hypothetical protein